MNDSLFMNGLIALAIVAGFAILGQLLKKFLSVVVSGFLLSTRTKVDERILEVIRSRIGALSVVIGVMVAIGEFRGTFTAGQALYERIFGYVHGAFYFLLVLLLIRLAGRIVTTVLEWYMEDVTSKTKSAITPTVIPMVSKIVNIVIFLIAMVIVLDHFGISIGSLLVSLGVGSLAVAWAAQETLANMISGIVILADQPFRVGDRIRLPSGEEGDVTAIGLRSTRILNYENNLIVVPNSELVKNRVINFSFPNPSMRVLVDVGVAYGTDIAKARSVMLGLAPKFPEIAADPAPEVHLVEFGDSSLRLRFVGRANEFALRWNTENALREEIYVAFRKAGIGIPFPQRIVHLHSADESQSPQKH